MSKLIEEIQKAILRSHTAGVLQRMKRRSGSAPLKEITVIDWRNSTTMVYQRHFKMLFM